jgi:pimeloyl-ACP methyl ester carboxylesterase
MRLLRRRGAGGPPGPGTLPGPGVRRRPWWRRAGRALGVGALALVALLLASTALNLALVRYERATLAPYGERVRVGDGAVNVVDHGGEGPAVVLLGGLGTPAPALDFAPLARELEGHRVVVVEGFGYGYSDLEAPARTVENVSAELHAALAARGVEAPYVLMGHSLAGFYMLDYVDRYPGEVSAVVGIDPTVPAAGPEEPEDGGPGIPWQRLAADTGLLRWTLLVAPGLGEPDGPGYTPEERRRIRLMTAWNYGNPAVVDETRRIADNARRLRGVGYPPDLPVLVLLSRETVELRPEWLPRHEEQLRAVRRHELVVLDGGHYLHWTRSPEIAREVTGFLEHQGAGRAAPPAG